MATNSGKLLTNRDLREQCIERFDVLEKVKRLLFIPGTELATVKQVAEYYGVGVEAIQSACADHKDELVEDGVCVKSYVDLSGGEEIYLEKMKGKVIFHYANGDTFYFPNRGLRVFPRRAILRIGMLLRDSTIAKETIAQLLNIEEKTSETIKTTNIDEEQSLALSLGMAYASGNNEAIRIAHGKMLAFKNRHIEKFTKENEDIHF